MSSQKHPCFIPFSWLCFRSSFWPCLQLAGSLNAALAQREKKGQNFWKCSTDCWCKRIRHARVESGPWVFQKRIKGELSFNPVLVSTRRRMGEKEKNSFVLQKDDKGLCRGRKWGEGSISSLVSQERGTEHPIKNRYFVNIPRWRQQMPNTNTEKIHTSSSSLSKEECGATLWCVSCSKTFN